MSVRYPLGAVEGGHEGPLAAIFDFLTAMLEKRLPIISQVSLVRDIDLVLKPYNTDGEAESPSWSISAIRSDGAEVTVVSHEWARRAAEEAFEGLPIVDFSDFGPDERAAESNEFATGRRAAVAVARVLARLAPSAPDLKSTPVSGDRER